MTTATGGCAAGFKVILLIALFIIMLFTIMYGGFGRYDFTQALAEINGAGPWSPKVYERSVEKFQTRIYIRHSNWSQYVSGLAEQALNSRRDLLHALKDHKDHFNELASKEHAVISLLAIAFLFLIISLVMQGVTGPGYHKLYRCIDMIILGIAAILLIVASSLLIEIGEQTCEYFSFPTQQAKKTEHANLDFEERLFNETAPEEERQSYRSYGFRHITDRSGFKACHNYKMEPLTSIGACGICCAGVFLLIIILLACTTNPNRAENRDRAFGSVDQVQQQEPAESNDDYVPATSKSNLQRPAYVPLQGDGDEGS